MFTGIEMKRTLVAGLLTVSAGASFAQIYVGAGATGSNFEFDCSGASSCDWSSLGGKAYIGYAFTPNVMSEISYLNFGRAKLTAMAYVNGYGNTLVRAKFDITAITAAMAVRTALSQSWGIVGRLGVAQVKAAGNGQVDQIGSASYSETQYEPYGGLSLEYNLTKSLKTFLSADFTQGGDEDLRMVGWGAQYSF